MENLSQEDKTKIQTEKLFNTSEGVIKKWIAKFSKKTTDELFDVVPDTEPVIFFPSEKSDGKFVKLELGIVPYNYSAELPTKLLEEKLVQDSLQFFTYSVRVVYSSIMKTTDRTLAHDAMLEWDSSSMTFSPKFFPDVKKKSDYLNFVFAHMMNARKQIPEEKVPEWEKDFAELTNDINATKKQMSDEKIHEKIEEKTLEWSECDRIGIIVSYLDREDLPDDPNIKSISDKKYEDPPEEKTKLSTIDQIIQDVNDIILNKEEDILNNNSKNENNATDFNEGDEGSGEETSKLSPSIEVLD